MLTNPRGSNWPAVLDGVVISIVPIRDQTILRDNAVIERDFDKDYVLQLKDILNSGSLPGSLKVVNVEKT